MSQGKQNTHILTKDVKVILTRTRIICLLTCHVKKNSLSQSVDSELNFSLVLKMRPEFAADKRPLS